MAKTVRKARTRVLSVSNQKGGVGKTTTAVNLGAALASLGVPTLLVDLDPQGNAGSGLGRAKDAEGSTVYDLLLGTASLDQCIAPTNVEGLDLVPSTVDLYGAEVELVSLERRERRLAEALAQAAGYEVVLVDCAPSLGLLTLNALTAADRVLVPLQCEYYALEGISQLLRTIDLVKAGPNPRLSLEGILLTMFDARNNLAHQVAAEIRKHFGQTVFKTVIPRNVRLSEAPSFGQSVVEYDRASKGSESYLALAEELRRRWTRE